ncbi:hypothetical protein GCM10018790_60700 [Kitasatospora xanthocidica]|nr:hypothetical protein GCM10018790_60700 [Kitasatospora xanthocidica]
MPSADLLGTERPLMGRPAPARLRASTLGGGGGYSGHYGNGAGPPPARLTRSGENPILRFT